MLLTLDNAHLAYGHVALLDGAQLAIEESERIALIGANGSGKSSLMRALAGEAGLDDGALWRRPGLRLAHVAQQPQFVPGATVYQTIAAGLGEAAGLLLRFHEAALAVSLDPSPENLAALEELQEELDHCNAWSLYHRVDDVISRLQLDGEARVDSLSGGGMKRVALAQALVGEPELLLLDEPTNHLDLDGILWLEQLISAYSGSVLVITHDRAFLDAVATRIVELDRGRLASYPGSFAAYQERKAAELAAEAREQQKFDRLLGQEEVWVRKGVEARRTRNEGRVRRLEALRLERAARRERLGKADMRLASGEHSGKLVAELTHVSKRFGERVVIHDFSCRIMRGDKIALIGPNGAGKTTLLKLILGELAADSGSVRRGTRLEVAYFDQLRASLDEEATLIDVISPGAEFIDVGGRRTHVISYLGDFLFPPQRARSPVKSLSGGERARLLLARLFARPANVLVLDEPTNDLDIETLELLESLLQDYAGTLFLVSHDRRFVDNIVTQSIVSEGGGRWREYAGGYADWRAAAERQKALADAATPPQRPKAARKPAEEQPGTMPERQQGRLTYREKQELAALEARIEELERQQAQASERLADPASYRDPERLRQLQESIARHQAELDVALARWEELAPRAE